MRAVGLEAVGRRTARAEGLQRVWSVTPDSYAFVSNILVQRADDSQTFFALKQQQTVKAVSDPDFYNYIYTDLKPGSPVKPATARLEAVEDAVKETPVPFAWVRNVLTVPELAQLAAMPLKLIRATIYGLYLSENIDSLTASEYAELKRLQAV